MNEINPYEPPRSVPDEKASPSAVKQVVGVGTILLLTPIAIGVAFFTSCIAVEFSVDPMIRWWGFDVAIPFGLTIFLLPPVAIHRVYRSCPAYFLRPP